MGQRCLVYDKWKSEQGDNGRGRGEGADISAKIVTNTDTSSSKLNNSLDYFQANQIDKHVNCSIDSLSLRK